MSKDQYKVWLTSVPEDNTKAKCKLCAKTFVLLNMEEQALKSHVARKKHITVVTETQRTDSVRDFFTVKCGATHVASSSESLGEPSTPSFCDTEDTNKDSGSVTAHRNPMTKFALRKEQLKAEILWVLKYVMSHFSFNSSTDITDILKAMFPDSAVAQKMKIGPNKLSYLIFYAIAPYLKQQLLVELKGTQCFVISFDESINNEFHKEQIDFFGKYLNKD